MASPFVAAFDLNLAPSLKQTLLDQGFVITAPPYTIFSGKKKGVNCTVYQSGKIVVQGAEMAPFIEFFLEPLMGCFDFTHPVAIQSQTSRIGIDESGKGDFYGPLCVAEVYVKAEQFKQLHSIGVKDSKALSDKTICQLAAQIKALCTYQIIRINPPKYNEIYQSFLNLNKLLAWGHATTIEKLIEKSGCQEVIIDQFASEWVVLHALKKKKLQPNLTQRHRGEEDLSVAAASILAREAFLQGLKNLSEEAKLTLPKGGGSNTIKIGQIILATLGKEKLLSLCKHHFKNLDAILQKPQN